jgi:hypothetical protein
MTSDAAHYTSMLNPPAYIAPAVAEGAGWPIYGQVSSGCLLLIECFSQRATRPGYLVVHIENRHQASLAAPNNYSGLMEEIRQGFGRTLSRLPGVFGVSRQSLYNWLDGEMPNERHQARIMQLAEAARSFLESSFTPTSASLTRTLSRGRSFIELMADGEDGREAARKLMVLTQRSLISRARLDAALVGTGSAPSAGPRFGAPALDED